MIHAATTQSRPYDTVGPGVSDLPTPSTLCYSTRVLLPFARLVERRTDIPAAARVRLISVDPDQRFPIAESHAWLEAVVGLTNDPDLGLDAAREVNVGDYGAVEYAARSATTWGDVCAVVGRYMRLINDALEFSLKVEGDLAQIRLDSKVPLPRAAADFQSGAFHISASHFWPRGATPEFEVWFTHARPENIAAYERTFPGGKLRFDAPFNGFVMSKDYLDVQVEGADPKLHALIRDHADALLAKLPNAQAITMRVRDLIAKELSGGDPTVAQIARQLPMGERTLARRLGHEGTTFKEVLDGLRKQLAMELVAENELSLSEVASALGFSQSAPFHRAFKRWTGETPLTYRRGRRS
jgi:AraC-like DNA-binding protein